MSTPVLTSTFFLTILLLIGLLFFIRASVKDRTQEVGLVSDQTEVDLLQQLQEYFTQRAYKVVSVDADRHQVTFEGFVRPSWFLASFLTFLAAVGLLCIALVLSLLIPQFSPAWFGLVLLSPAAGLFYWRRAARPEQVALKVEGAAQVTGHQTLLTVKAHRDELAELQKSLALRLSD